MTYRILVVEDSPTTLERICAELNTQHESLSFETTGAATVSEAFAKMEAVAFDACVLDLVLPNGMGLALVTSFLTFRPEMPIVILTGLEDRATETEIVKLPNVQDYLRKHDMQQQEDFGAELGKRLHYAIVKHAARIETDRRYQKLLAKLQEA